MRQARFAARLAVTLAVLLAAAHCIGWEFGADDVRFVRWYTELTSAHTIDVRWPAVWSDFVGPWGGNDNEVFYRPIVSLSLALDFQLFGLHAGTTAFLNLLVHLASALCVHRVALHVLPGEKAALPAALLFGLTPLAHENIAWAVGRCGLTVLFGLLSGLLLLRGYARSRRGPALHALPLVFVGLNLLTMESAVGWSLFPPLCLFLYLTFHGSGARLPLRALTPYLGLAAAYLCLRLVLFGAVSSRSTAELFPGDAGALFRAPFEILWETLVPRDASWLPRGPASSLYRALCVFPLVIGLAAPFYFKDPRSRAYRRALVTLLGFWLLTRLPTLLVLRLGDDLEGSRTAYYSYAPLALLTGLLAATVRYARWSTFLLALVFGLNLHHRISERVAWAAVGRQARDLVYREAEQKGALLGSTDANLLVIVNNVDGTGGAPVFHPGEILLVLYPPFVERRVLGVSVHGFTISGEWGAAAWIARAVGRLFRIAEPAAPDRPVRAEFLDPGIFLLPPLFPTAPERGLRPRLEGAGRYPTLVLPDGWRDTPGHGTATPVLLLAAGPRNVVARLETGRGWPPAARAALEEWARLGGSGAPFGCFIETREDAADPKSAKARSQVLIGSIR